ncbi:MAG: Asp-tRNA(Asn)/Glu-tRNA(Gln) amidotransferase subunit GatC [Gemmatimonadetes bacterium]|nr:Asp-tRNA(Asn)/Glu-tRNA(Gln) amidotransferase subunit GatC [Gemmatimonadota bacterium]
MTFDRKNLEHVARLSMLSLSEDELDSLAHDLDHVLSHFEAIQRIDVSGIDDTDIEKAIDTPLRSDTPAGSLSNEEATRQSARAEGGLFVVPKVIG